MVAISVGWYKPELDSKRSRSSCVHCTESERMWQRLLGVRGWDDLEAVVGGVGAADATGLMAPLDRPFSLESGEEDGAGPWSAGVCRTGSGSMRAAIGESVFASVLSSDRDTSEDFEGNVGETERTFAGSAVALGTAAVV